MTKTWGAAAIAAVLLVAALGATSGSDNDAKSRRGVFATLKVGQPVNLKDVGASYEISTFDTDVPQGHTVLEVENDYVVLRDIAKVADNRIPIYAVKSVSLIRTKPGDQ